MKEWKLKRCLEERKVILKDRGRRNIKSEEWKPDLDREKLKFKMKKRARGRQNGVGEGSGKNLNFEVQKY